MCAFGRLPLVTVLAFALFTVFGCAEKNRSEVVQPLKGWRELLARGDGSIDSFVQLSVEEAEQFRHRFLQPEPDRLAKIESVALLMKEFVAQSPSLLDADLEVFDVQPERIVSAFRGDAGKAVDPQAVFGPFTGEWHGRWDDFDVDHQWGDVVSVRPPRAIDVALGSNRQSVRLLAWQYAWLGDGYGLNLVVEDGTDSAKPSRQVVLGYVEHLRDGNFDDITARRPHVGIDAGHGKIIWITAGEVFFEQAHFENGVAKGYSIVGFDYAMTEDEVQCRRAFKTYYDRNATKARKPFRSESCSLRVVREYKPNASPSG